MQCEEIFICWQGLQTHIRSHCLALGLITGGHVFEFLVPDGLAPPCDNGRRQEGEQEAARGGTRSSTQQQKGTRRRRQRGQGEEEKKKNTNGSDEDSEEDHASENQFLRRALVALEARVRELENVTMVTLMIST